MMKAINNGGKQLARISTVSETQQERTHSLYLERVS